MKRLLGIFAFLVFFFSIIFSSGCATVPIQEEDVPCDWHEAAYEYVCYDTDECRQYLNGYSAVMKSRFEDQKYGWFIEDGDTQRVNINLFYDHKGIYIMGYIIGTRHGNRVWIDVTTWACDVELNLIAKPATLGGWAQWTLEDK